MKTIGLSDIEREDYDAAASLVVELLRTGFPKLDLRKGTVLRDLLVQPDGVLAAVSSKQIGEVRDSTSLLRLSERDAAGESIDEEDVSAILSNFNMKANPGSRATGLVIVKVDRQRTYTISSDVVFSTVMGVGFRPVKSVVASNLALDGAVELRAGVQGYWFTVPVECVDAGPEGNIEHGTPLTPSSSVNGFVSASAYGQFSGGSDMEPVSSIVSRIGSALSMRGLTTKAAIEAALRDRFDGTDNSIVDVSVCGYGSKSQLRDKHNAFGVAVGGRADIYVRNFGVAPFNTVVKEVEPGDDGTASFEITAAEIPGMYCVDRVFDAESTAMSSYDFTQEWHEDGLSSTWHDIDPVAPAEVMGTVWRKCSVTVKGLEKAEDGSPVKLRVDVIALPDVSDMQKLVDDGAVRNVGVDHVVRCPVVVRASVNATARVPAGVDFDKETAVSRIVDYVNSTGFVGRLTRSEISSILRGLGARSVDLSDEDDMLHGYGYDALGRKFMLSGDALDVDRAPSWCVMVSKETCVFATSEYDVVVNVISE